MPRTAPLSIIVSLAIVCAAAEEKPIAVKVVVVAMFERGADTGDQPGEYQYWVERSKLDRVIPFPQGYHDLRMNSNGVLGTVTGVGTAKAAASIMALGLDPRFDLRKSYWLVAGIAGIDPADGSLGSAAWAEWVVDGDLAHEIDAREIPSDWKTGYVPLRRSVPFEQPHQAATDQGEVYHLNAALMDWAFNPHFSHSLRHVQLTRRPSLILEDVSRGCVHHGQVQRALGAIQASPGAAGGVLGQCWPVPRRGSAAPFPWKSISSST